MMLGDFGDVNVSAEAQLTAPGHSCYPRYDLDLAVMNLGPDFFSNCAKNGYSSACMGTILGVMKQLYTGLSEDALIPHIQMVAWAATYAFMGPQPTCTPDVLTRYFNLYNQFYTFLKANMLAPVPSFYKTPNMKLVSTAFSPKKASGGFTQAAAPQQPTDYTTWILIGAGVLGVGVVAYMFMD